MIERQYILSSTGFARPARMLIGISNKYLSKLVLEYKGISVELNYSLDSIMDVMSLGIIPGAQFIIRAEGIDEDQALQLIDDHFSKMKLISL
ncbi:HPr family phosphocarrier protein [Bacillus sp. ISL-18]|uniref:HPr family phosphocarrier protein n=1 Tax=Bacillaceae TaxID=186817 RepID=UPI001BE8D840|nr:MULTISPECIES: HPr family phosphocarrier protein [Bacillaceae]MBT2653994.1 HPr family phosphocarrier protein [Bacillus sp. ISL-18]ULT58238.1 HPr family phosphocarrier protein [Neobacillus drentensis]